MSEVIGYGDVTLNNVSGYYDPSGQNIQYPQYQSYGYWPYGWTWPAAMQPKRFNGKLESIDDLPSGNVGDSYYVKHPDVLVVRSSDGWVIVPKAE